MTKQILTSTVIDGIACKQLTVVRGFCFVIAIPRRDEGRKETIDRAVAALKRILSGGMTEEQEEWFRKKASVLDVTYADYYGESDKEGN